MINHLSCAKMRIINRETRQIYLPGGKIFLRFTFIQTFTGTLFWTFACCEKAIGRYYLENVSKVKNLTAKETGK